ncbi:MAG: tetratricopeptide repeat protein [Fidelibacterota bacterium]
MDLKNLQDLELYFSDHFDTVIFPVLAEHYLLQGEFGRAHRVCEIGFDHHPEFLPGLFVEARIYLAEGELKTSEKLLKQIIFLDPAHYSAHVLLAEVQTALRRGERTLNKVYTRILEMDRANEKARRWVRKPKKRGKAPSPHEKREGPGGRVTKDSEEPPARKAAASKSPVSLGDVERRGGAHPRGGGKVAPQDSLAGLSISPEIATFTLMAILKSQHLYEQALEVLAVMSQKEGADTERIDQERMDLIGLLQAKKEKR